MPTSRRRGRPCPRCGSRDTIPIVFGYPGPELIAAAQQGEVVLGGCCITGDDPAWRCRSCGKDFGRR